MCSKDVHTLITLLKLKTEIFMFCSIILTNYYNYTWATANVNIDETMIEYGLVYYQM